jgi:hypothetical protein
MAQRRLVDQDVSATRVHDEMTERRAETLPAASAIDCAPQRLRRSISSREALALGRPGPAHIEPEARNEKEQTCIAID